MNVQEINTTNLGLKLVQAFRVPARFLPQRLESHGWTNTKHCPPDRTDEDISQEVESPVRSN
eukprot:3427735-Prorocentrum_lima.AAC.1